MSAALCEDEDASTSFEDNFNDLLIGEEKRGFRYKKQ